MNGYEYVAELKADNGRLRLENAKLQRALEAVRDVLNSPAPDLMCYLDSINQILKEVGQ